MAVQRGRRKRRFLLGLPAKHHGLECCVAQPMSEMGYKGPPSFVTGAAGAPQ
jgi:hypothetical protein